MLINASRTYFWSRHTWSGHKIPSCLFFVFNNLWHFSEVVDGSLLSSAVAQFVTASVITASCLLSSFKINRAYHGQPPWLQPDSSLLASGVQHIIFNLTLLTTWLAFISRSKGDGWKRTSRGARWRIVREHQFDGMDSHKRPGATCDGVSSEANWHRQPYPKGHYCFSVLHSNGIFSEPSPRGSWTGNARGRPPQPLL